MGFHLKGVGVSTQHLPDLNDTFTSRILLNR
ncbi:hypothetical protein VPHK479_0070 [Vibrio phage K479]